VIARILLWNLGASQTSIDELRTRLPELEPPSVWLWNDAGERFGLVIHGDELPGWLPAVRDLIGAEPEVAEEFDVV
jgi:hypothetical protein